MEMSNKFRKKYKQVLDEINIKSEVKYNLYEEYFKIVDNLFNNSLSNDMDDYFNFETEFLGFASNSELLIDVNGFIDLFENVLFNNGKLINDISNEDIRYILMFFSYLYTIYKKFHGKDKDYSITDIGLSEEEILEKLDNIRIMNKNNEDVLSYLDEVNQLLAIKSNLFSKDMINNYLRLYYFIIEKNIDNNKFISINKITELMVNLLCDYKMKEEVFDLIARSPINLINSKIIELIYDNNSARFVYNSLNNMVLSVDKLNKFVIIMFNRILDILSKSECRQIIDAFNKYKDINIDSFSIDDKIYIMSMLETDIFWSLKVNGIYHNNYDLFGQDISFDINRRINYSKVFNENINKNNLLDVDSDVFSEDFVNLLENVIINNKVNSDNKIIIDWILMNSEMTSVVLDEMSKFMFLKNNDGSCLIPSSDVKDAFLDKFDEIPISIIKTSDRLNVDVFNDLRFIYNEMIGYLNRPINDYFYIKSMIKDFNNISNIYELLENSRDILENYELSDMINKANNILLNENYDSNRAKEYLYNDFKLLNIDNIDEKFNELLNYTKVKKTLLSAANFWNVYTKTQNLKIDKDGQEYTPVVANYFKSVEILLNRKIKDKYTKLVDSGIDLLVPRNVRNKEIDFTKNEELMLGEIANYIFYEKRIVNDDYDNLLLYEKLRNWISNVRNSNFHTDLILTKSQAEFYKKQSLLIICDILEYL